MNIAAALASLSTNPPSKPAVSRWFVIDQARIDAFAAVTEDLQFIHVDPERARAGAFNGTIAHGFLTLSMISAMSEDACPPPGGLKHAINYGFNKIRFIHPVPSGASIRGVFSTLSATPEKTWITHVQNVNIEIKGESRPALVAEWITRLYLA